MSEMVERVARAISQFQDICKSDSSAQHCIKSGIGSCVCRNAASAAIDAMREPTYGMIMAGADADNQECGIIGRQSAIEAWQVMIDEALK